MPIEVEHVITGCVSEAEARVIALKLVESCWRQSERKITRPQEAVAAMQCTASNGYAGWSVRDKATGDLIPNVIEINPRARTYLVSDDNITRTRYFDVDITVDIPAATFWIVKAPVTVAPLSPGRQADPEPTDQPCADCCQPDVCRRTNYCAAHRCAFGSVAP